MSKQQKKLVETEKENALAEAKADDEVIEELINCYDKTAEHLQSEIQRIVYKFAEDNELTTDVYKRQGAQDPQWEDMSGISKNKKYKST